MPIRDHQVVVVAGKPARVKPLSCPNVFGAWPRPKVDWSYAATAAGGAACRGLAEELSVPLGEQVGYQVRFNDQSSPSTLVKLMTDGILLAETQHDPLLLRYDTLIIDEAHERSLNIDFLLGYLKRLLPKRPDLKVIITSATSTWSALRPISARLKRLRRWSRCLDARSR